MTTVVKKTKKSSSADLLTALSKLIYLLEGQNEKEAVEDLRIAMQDLQRFLPQSEEYQAALNLILEAFHGDHELVAYTHRRAKDEGEWGVAEELYLASTSVLTKVKRLKN